MVHFSARELAEAKAAKSSRHVRNSEEIVDDEQVEKRGKLLTLQGVIFFAAFVTLIGVLLIGATAFRAVSWSLLMVIVISLLGYLIRRIRGQHSDVGASDVRQAVNFLISPCERAAQSGVSLIAAAACVGIILGVVTLTGIGSKLPSTLLPLATTNLMLALFFLMISTIILGMGLPSSVCYLLMAILVGPVLLDLGVVPTCSAFFHLLFRDDVDGDTTCRIGSLCCSCDRRLRNNGNSVRRIQIRARPVSRCPTRLYCAPPYSGWTAMAGHQNSGRSSGISHSRWWVRLSWRLRSQVMFLTNCRYGHAASCLPLHSSSFFCQRMFTLYGFTA